MEETCHRPLCLHCFWNALRNRTQPCTDRLAFALKIVGVLPNRNTTPALPDWPVLSLSMPGNKVAGAPNGEVINVNTLSERVGAPCHGRKL